MPILYIFSHIIISSNPLVSNLSDEMILEKEKLKIIVFYIKNLHIQRIDLKKSFKKGREEGLLIELLALVFLHSSACPTNSVSLHATKTILI